MKPGDEGHVVRTRFSQPSVEPLKVLASRHHGDGVVVEVAVTPRFPFRTGESVRILVKSATGRTQATASFICWSGDAAWFNISDVVRAELRESERVTTELPARIRQLGGDLEGTVADMSRGGLRVLVDSAPTSKTIVLGIVAPELQVELLCRVLAQREEGARVALHVAVDRVLSPATRP